MALKFQRGRVPATQKRYFKVLIYSDSGAGKTWAVAKAKNVLVVLTEKNGEQSIRVSNPDARYIIVSSMDEIREIIAEAIAGTLGTPEDPIDTIAFDGLTEIQQLFKDEILAQKGGGEAVMFIEDWGTLSEKMRRFLRVIRDLPYNVIATSLAESEMEGEVRHTFPAFQGKKLYSEVMGYFNLVGYLFKTVGKKDAIDRTVMFDAASKFQCKGQYPVNGQRKDSVQDWLNDLTRGSDGTKQPDTTDTKTDVKTDEKPTLVLQVQNTTPAQVVAQAAAIAATNARPSRLGRRKPKAQADEKPEDDGDNRNEDLHEQAQDDEQFGHPGINGHS